VPVTPTATRREPLSAMPVSVPTPDSTLKTPSGSGTRVQDSPSAESQTAPPHCQVHAFSSSENPLSPYSCHHGPQSQPESSAPTATRPGPPAITWDTNSLPASVSAPVVSSTRVQVKTAPSGITMGAGTVVVTSSRLVVTSATVVVARLVTVVGFSPRPKAK
jgi:hypothetical protein